MRLPTFVKPWGLQFRNSVKPSLTGRKKRACARSLKVDPSMDAIPSLTTRNSTAKKAAEILVAKQVGFIIPTAKQKLNLLIAFAKKNMVIYGKAFDIVKLQAKVNLDDLADVERNLEKIRIYEIKSTSKKVGADFSKYFFGITGAEVLVAQSLKRYFKFIFVNTTTGDFLEMDLAQIFGRAKGIYPTWSICF